MLITGIKSRPVYDRLAPMSTGHFHLIAAQGSGGKAVSRLLDEFAAASASVKSPITVLYSTESFTGMNHLAELQAYAGITLISFNSNTDLLAHLKTALTRARMGTRLYLAGSESFIGTAMQVANQFNLNNDEVLREHNGSFVRRVYCVHCDTFTENVTHRVFTCPGCSLDLVVRDHYSRRLAAFMGVKADAEVPGELPEAEELDT